LDAIKLKMDRFKFSQTEIQKESAANQSQITAYHLHIEQIQQSIEHFQKTLSFATDELKQIDTELLLANDKRVHAAQAAEAASVAKSDADNRLRIDRAAVLHAQQQLLATQGKLHGVRERLHVLKQLEEQYTGAGRGGQQLLRLARGHQNSDFDQSHPSGAIVANPWGTVVGLVADLLVTEMHLAPLIDVALGTHSDAIVLTNGQIVDWINDGSFEIDGRVTLIRLDRLASRRSGEKIQLDGLRGVLGRADRMTRFDDAYEPLIRFLLGTTWFVDTLSTALELSHFRGAGLRFVTAECQLIESDGSITLGSLQTGLGLVSRRSEMQAAGEEIKHVELSVVDSAANLANAQSTIYDSESWLRTQEGVSHAASRELTACDLRIESIEQRKGKLTQSLESHQQNVNAAQLRLEEIQKRIEQAETAVSRNIVELQELENSLVEIMAAHSESIQFIQREQSLVTEQRIHLARTEQHVTGLRTTIEQMQQDTEERIANLKQAQENIDLVSDKIAATQKSAEEFQLRAISSREAIQIAEARQNEASSQIQTQNASLQQSIRLLDSAKRSLEKCQDKIQAIEQQQEQLTIQWQILHEHYTSEYQVDLNALAEILQPIQLQDRVLIESEIVHLRQEIQSSGSVNMEALSELDELQRRFDRLSNHYQDLDDAKMSLVKTMAKIDEDSRELFITTLTTIRKNFQELYRRSFGGGFADIVLENENDPDSGIEIVATPPGKTTLSNSLLSGGEKALTAVALIMAFFQFRPSPFCILDEVDAPFDEANIGRFVTVLREFLDTTKFIVVTHSKKTMTAANMIYGITMQESGVSRQVSVRFEEVGDKGEIIREGKRAA